MRIEKWVTPKKMIVLQIAEDGGYLKLLDYTKKPNKDKFEEITLARWG